jgi:hypothetical protein
MNAGWHQENAHFGRVILAAAGVSRGQSSFPRITPENAISYHHTGLDTVTSHACGKKYDSDRSA